MSLSRKLGKLPPELRPLLEAVEPRQSFSSAELDQLLATLQPEVFEDQLESLLVWLDKRALDFERTPKDTHLGNSGLPSGGRISRRYLQEVTKYAMMTREEEMAFARRMEFVAARVTAAEFATAAEQAQRQSEYLQVRRDFKIGRAHV